MDLSGYAKYLNATYTDEVYFFMPADNDQTDDYGDPVDAWKPQPMVMGSVQEYSGDLAFKEYGMQVDCKKRIFLPPGTVVSPGWGVAFAAAAAKPELIVKWAPAKKTHKMVLAGTR